MALPLLVKAIAEKKVSRFCESRAPRHVRHQLRLIYLFSGNTVTIIERRAPWQLRRKEWHAMPIAQIRYNERAGTWRLYYPDAAPGADATLRWQEYGEREATRDIDALLREIDEDSAGIFWG